MDEHDLAHRFTYHPPQAGQPARYEHIRAKALEFAFMINDLVPDGREKSLAITQLEMAVMFANAGISRERD